MSARDAIAMLVAGKMPPCVNFVEGAMEAFKTLAAWYQSDDFGNVHMANVGLVGQFLQQVQQQATAEAQQQAAQQASQQFQQSMGGGQGGQGGGGGGTGQAPEMTTEQPTAAEIGGGGTQGPPGSASA